MKQLVAVLVVCLALVGCGENSSQEHVDNAKAFLDKNEYAAAIIELKNALKKDVDNKEARFLLGKTYFGNGDLQGAEKELGRALELGGQDNAVVPLYSQVLLALGKHDPLSQLSPDNLDSAGLSTLLAAQAQSLLMMGHEERAQPLIDKAMAEETPSVYAIVTAARFSLLDDASGKNARELLDNALEMDEKYAPAWSLLGDLEVRAGQLSAADQAYSQAIQFSRGNFADHYKRGLARVSAQRLDDAKKDIAALEKLSAEHPGLYFLKGTVALQESKLDVAKGAFEKAALADSSYPLSLYNLAAIYHQEGNLATATNKINQFLVLAPKNAQGLKLAATIEYQQGNYERAQELLEPVVVATPDDVFALNLMANILIAQGKQQEGMDLLQKVAELEPDSAQALTRLGAGLFASGEQSLGIASLQQALKLEPENQQAEIALLVGYMQKGDLDAALIQALAFKDKQPDKALPYTLLGQVLLAQGKEADAREQFSQALRVSPGDPAAGQLLANLALRDRDLKTARHYYEQILSVHDTHLQTLLNLAALNALEGQEQPMVELVQKAMNAHPEALQPKIVMARYYLLKRQAPEALRVLDGLPEAQRNVPEVMALSAEAEIGRQNYKASLSTLKKLVAQQPDNAHSHFLLARAYTGMKQLPEAIGELEKTIALEPDHFIARVALSRLYLLTGKNDSFEAQVKYLQTLAPERAEVLQLEAALANRKGNREEAESKLEAVFKHSPSSQTAIALAAQRRASGDLEGAVEVLRTWMTEHQQDIAARVALAEFLTASGQEENAISEYKDLIKLDGKNVPALNNLAWLLRDRDTKQALEYIQQASSLAPESASVLDTQAVLLMKNGQLERAQRSIDSALKFAPTHPSVLFHRAQISVARGDKDSASKTLTALLAEDTAFPEKAEARQLLDSLK